jgi:hypothetical protein
MTEEELQKLIEGLTRVATDRGQIIELGWLGFRLAAIPAEAPQVQIEEMRNAFYAGAHHLFASIMTMLDPDSEPTQADMNRLSMINSELEEFVRQFKLKHKLP